VPMRLFGKSNFVFEDSCAHNQCRLQRICASWDALSLPTKAIQRARTLPNLEFFEFQWLSENLKMESEVSFSHRSITGWLTFGRRRHIVSQVIQCQTGKVRRCRRGVASKDAARPSPEELSIIRSTMPA
jgi:hypothetical protein